jgi:PadR family transcriptional regulator PadR
MPSGCDVRGLLCTALVLLVAEEAGHGYVLSRRLDDLGIHEVDHSRVYRALRELEDEGILVSSWDHHGSGAARRSYDITAKGLAFLDFEAEQLRQASVVLSRMLERIGELSGRSAPGSGLATSCRSAASLPGRAARVMAGRISHSGAVGAKSGR